MCYHLLRIGKKHPGLEGSDVYRIWGSQSECVCLPIRFPDVGQKTTCHSGLFLPCCPPAHPWWTGTPAKWIEEDLRRRQLGRQALQDLGDDGLVKEGDLFPILKMSCVCLIVSLLDLTEHLPFPGASLQD